MAKWRKWLMAEGFRQKRSETCVGAEERRRRARLRVDRVHMREQTWCIYMFSTSRAFDAGSIHCH